MINKTCGYFRAHGFCAGILASTALHTGLLLALVAVRSGHGIASPRAGAGNAGFFITLQERTPDEKQFADLGEALRDSTAPRDAPQFRRVADSESESKVRASDLPVAGDSAEQTSAVPAVAKDSMPLAPPAREGINGAQDLERNSPPAPRMRGGNDAAVVLHDAPAMAAPENQLPIYPARARRRGQEGEVTVRFVVSTTGELQEIETLAATGSDLFEAAVYDAVRRWRFEPATRAGKAVATVLTRNFTFRIETAGARRP